MTKKFLFRLLALLLCLTLALPCALAEDLLLASPELPDMPPYPTSDSPYGMPWGDAYDAWRESVRAQQRDGSYADGLEPFLQQSSQAFLSGTDGENRVYSPLSLYMALAMLAETTGGEARQQVLTLLGQPNLESLRQQASDLWNANYRNDGAMTRTLATSLWLSDDIPFCQETVDALAEHYYAASYQGRMGSSEMNAALQHWLNDNTLGLMEKQVQSVQLPPLTVAAIASTVAFSAKWDSTFVPDATRPQVFHTPKGDVTRDFMHSSQNDTLYWGERFQAVQRPFEQDGRMWLILPDEGVSPEDLLEDEDALSFLTCRSFYDWPDSVMVKLNLSVPKFDVSSQMELSEGLQSLGVTEAFQPDADFSPLTGADIPIALSQVRHDARVSIDEDGCKAAAYTIMMMAGTARPREYQEVDFVLDRPFLFVITGANGLPMFVGVVNQP